MINQFQNIHSDPNTLSHLDIAPVQRSQQQSNSMFPPMENLQQFKHHLHITLTKFAEPNLVSKAHEEINDLMSEHVTNSDRMNAFLGALSGPGDKTSPNNISQRKEMIKVYGSAAELYEESLLSFV